MVIPPPFCHNNIWRIGLRGVSLTLLLGFVSHRLFGNISFFHCFSLFLFPFHSKRNFSGMSNWLWPLHARLSRENEPSKSLFLSFSNTQIKTHALSHMHTSKWSCDSRNRPRRGHKTFHQRLAVVSLYPISWACECVCDTDTDPLCNITGLRRVMCHIGPLKRIHATHTDSLLHRHTNRVNWKDLYYCCCKTFL